MKKLLSFLLVAIIMIATLPVLPAAAASSDGLIYVVSNGEVTITSVDKSWLADGRLVIPNTLDGYPVTTIGQSAFWDCTQLTEVVFPENVKTIRSYAFSNCKNIERLTFKGSVSIETGAFVWCEALEEITGRVSYIGEEAFADCAGLKTFSFSEELTYIGKRAFLNCEALNFVFLPDSLEVIETEAFKNCRQLNDITLGNGLTRIGRWVFFHSGYYDNSDNWSNGMLYVGNYLVDTKYDLNGKVEIKADTALIADDAFNYRSYITELVVNEGLTSISQNAFNGCAALTKITLPESVTDISSGAFKNCSKLTDISVGKSVTHIGSGAFGDTAYYNNDANWENGLLYIENYLVDANWREISGALTIRSGTTVVADLLLTYCPDITSVTFPESVRLVGDRSFYNCEKLVSITVKGMNTAIGEEAFLPRMIQPVIYAPEGSAAASYAAQNLLSVEYIDPPPVAEQASPDDVKIRPYPTNEGMVFFYT